MVHFCSILLFKLLFSFFLYLSFVAPEAPVHQANNFFIFNLLNNFDNLPLPPSDRARQPYQTQQILSDSGASLSTRRDTSQLLPSGKIPVSNALFGSRMTQSFTDNNRKFIAASQDIDGQTDLARTHDTQAVVYIYHNNHRQGTLHYLSDPVISGVSVLQGQMDPSGVFYHNDKPQSKRIAYHYDNPDEVIFLDGSDFMSPTDSLNSNLIGIPGISTDAKHAHVWGKQFSRKARGTGRFEILIYLDAIDLSAANKGYIITGIQSSTRVAWIHFVARKTGPAVLKAVMDIVPHIRSFSRIVEDVIRLDGGSEFNLASQSLQLQGMQIKRSNPDQHEQQALVENFNKNLQHVMRMLTHSLSDNVRDLLWKQAFYYACLIHNLHRIYSISGLRLEKLLQDNLQFGAPVYARKASDAISKDKSKTRFGPHYYANAGYFCGYSTEFGTPIIYDTVRKGVFPTLQLSPRFELDRTQPMAVPSSSTIPTRRFPTHGNDPNLYIDSHGPLRTLPRGDSKLEEDAKGLSHLPNAHTHPFSAPHDQPPRAATHATASSMPDRATALPPTAPTIQAPPTTTPPPPSGTPSPLPDAKSTRTPRHDAPDQLREGQTRPPKPTDFSHTNMSDVNIVSSKRTSKQTSRFHENNLSSSPHMSPSHIQHIEKQQAQARAKADIDRLSSKLDNSELKKKQASIAIEWARHDKHNALTLVSAADVRGKEVIGGHMMTYLKPNGDWKSRVVVRGDQEHDTGEGAAATVHPFMVRFAMTLALAFSFIIRIADISSAYLHCKTDKEIYLKLSGKYYRINAAMNGLTSSGYIWGKHLDSKLRLVGTIPVGANAIYVHMYHDMIILTYIDDCCCLVKSEEKFQELLIMLRNEGLAIRDEGDSNFLNMNIERTNDRITLDYEVLITARCEEYECTDNQHGLPTVSNLQSDDDSKIDLSLKRMLQRIVGFLSYIASRTRPDISYITNLLASEVTKPTWRKLQIARSTMSYLYTSKHVKLAFSRSPDSLINTAHVFHDASFRASSSRLGFVILINNAAVAWKTWKLRTVAASTAEAEAKAAVVALTRYRGIQDACNDVLKLLQRDIITTAHAYCDNKAVVQNVTRSVHLCNERNQYIRHDYQYLRDYQELLPMQFVPTKYQLADTFTKFSQHPLRKMTMANEPDIIDMGRVSQHLSKMHKEASDSVHHLQQRMNKQ
jgi:hypothetical protein